MRSDIADLLEAIKSNDGEKRLAAIREVLSVKQANSRKTTPKLFRKYDVTPENFTKGQDDILN